MEGNPQDLYNVVMIVLAIGQIVIPVALQVIGNYTKEPIRKNQSVETKGRVIPPKPKTSVKVTLVRKRKLRAEKQLRRRGSK